MAFRYVAPSFVAYVIQNAIADLEWRGDDAGIRALVVDRLRRFVHEEIIVEHPPLANHAVVRSHLSDTTADPSEDQENGDMQCLS